MTIDLTSGDWIRTAEREPPDGEVVDAMDSGGHVQKLKLKGRLWWFPDGSMYVYFTPAYWKPSASDGDGESS